MGAFLSPHPYPSQANHDPSLPGALIQGAASQCPLVCIFESGTAWRPPAAARLCADHIFANLANPHPSLRRRTSRIMARVLQHFVVGEHMP
jgi:hypothetical protein